MAVAGRYFHGRSRTSTRRWRETQLRHKLIARCGVVVLDLDPILRRRFWWWRGWRWGWVGRRDVALPQQTPAAVDPIEMARAAVGSAGTGQGAEGACREEGLAYVRVVVCVDELDGGALLH